MSLEIVKHTLNEAREAIQSHGGDVELVDYKDDIVYVKLTGSCVGCPMSIFTVKLGLESRLKEVLPTIKKVATID